MRSRTPCLDVELAVDGLDATDESRAWLASLYPVETPEGMLLGVGLIIHDVTEQRRIETERARLFQAEHAARHRAQQLQTALAAVAAASTRSEVGRALIDLGLPALGAEAGVLQVTEPPEPDHTLVLASTGYDGTVLAPDQRHPLDAFTPIGDVIRRGVPVYLASPDELTARYPAAAGLLLRPGFGAWAALPLRSGGQVLGALGLAFRDRQTFHDQDRLVFGGFISQASDALDRAGRQEAEHDVAVTLQQSLLTADPLPTESTSVSVRYLPAVSALEVGGDFYDAVHLDEHRMLLIVGDVVGHGLEAAVAMGQLRSAAQALASAHGPAGLLSALDRFVTNNEQARFATVACLLLDPVRGELRYSLAGHPPPMVRRSDGSVVQLAAPRGAPLGTTTGPRLEGRVPLSGPSLVVLYTDGLIERRHEAITVGLDRLARALVEMDSTDCAEICDQLIDRMLSDYHQRDDAVIVCAATRPVTVRLTQQVQAQPIALASLRAGLRKWLIQLGAGPDEVSDILVAVIEAATNAIEHAGLTPEDVVSVEVEHSPPGLLTFVIHDGGRWRDGSSDPYRGRGIAIMHRLMDHVDIKVRDDGTTVTLQKHLDGEPI
jgi:anti-sigma regulatory factor (Ser/Thr protein kinase)